MTLNTGLSHPGLVTRSDNTDVSAALQHHSSETEARKAIRARAPVSQKVRAGDERRRHILASAVELGVIPELLARHGVKAPTLLIADWHVTQLTSLVLGHDEPAALAYVMDVRAQGAEPDAVLVDLLAPTARALGALWDDDLCDFTEVTIGLWRLQSAMRALAPADAMPKSQAPRVVMIPLPGEPQTFGLDMVADCFRRAGWNTWTGPVESSDALRTLVGQRQIEVLGFSIASGERLDDVRREISGVRRASQNQKIAIMVGGPCFSADPALAEAVGADATAKDARDAVVKATTLLCEAATTERHTP